MAYNETPQGWYYYGYVNYHIEKNEFDKALEYSLKAGVVNDQQMARASSLYWVNGQKDTALKYYKELINKYPDFTLDVLIKRQETWNLSKVSQKLIQNAFFEVQNVANK